MEEYLIYYLKVDVAALADVFEIFRNDVFQDAELDAAHYFGSPGLTMAWAFKRTSARPNVLKDPAMYEMFEHGVRGGMTFVNITSRKPRRTPVTSITSSTSRTLTKITFTATAYG